MIIQNAILATLVYHDIFDYPLKIEEIQRYLIGEEADPKKAQKAIETLVKNKKIKKDKTLIHLKGRKKIVERRQRRERFSKEKTKRAKFYSSLLKIIPTINLVAVSGALAMENAKMNDDIDLVIITSKNTLWSTRLLSNIILHPFRRKAGQPHTKDKACLNLFIEQSSLKIPTQNLYTAHEIAQMKPLWQRKNTYQRFLKANTWVKNYLPNWTPDTVNSKWKIRELVSRKVEIVNRRSPYSPFTIHHSLVEHIEALAKWAQLKYMQKKITTEKVGEHQLFFHPANTEERVLKEYLKRVRKI